MHNVGDNFIIQLFLMAAFCAFLEEESISGAAFLLRVGCGTQHEQLPHGRRVRHRVSIPPISIRFESFFIYLFFYFFEHKAENRLPLLWQRFTCK